MGDRVERSLFPKPLTPFIEMLETFCQIPERKDHSGLTTAGFSGAETLCRGTDCVTMEELAVVDNRVILLLAEKHHPS